MFPNSIIHGTHLNVTRLSAKSFFYLEPRSPQEDDTTHNLGILGHTLNYNTPFNMMLPRQWGTYRRESWSSLSCLLEVSPPREAAPAGSWFSWSMTSRPLSSAIWWIRLSTCSCGVVSVVAELIASSITWWDGWDELPLRKPKVCKLPISREITTKGDVFHPGHPLTPIMFAMEMWLCAFGLVDLSGLSI